MVEGVGGVGGGEGMTPGVRCCGGRRPSASRPLTPALPLHPLPPSAGGAHQPLTPPYAPPQAPLGPILIPLLPLPLPRKGCANGYWVVLNAQVPQALRKAS